MTAKAHCHDRRPHPPPDADQFPQLSRGEHSTSTRSWSCWSGRTAPARPICSRRSRSWRRAAACAARRSTRSRSPRATASWAVVGGGRRRARPRDARHRHRAARRGRRDAARASAASTASRSRSAAAFADHLRVVWLTPAMDGLFGGPASERRRFLDRLVLAVDADASSRVNALERALRSRNRLLEEPRPDPHWLDAIEHETAELAVAVAARAPRPCAACRRAAARPRPTSPFPCGRDRARRLDRERCCRSMPAAEIEDRYRAHAARQPRARRRRRPHARRPASHRSRRALRRRRTSPRADASTGEQKALLIGLVLAHAGLLAEMTGFAPVLLLDEVVAHLDPGRRAALYDALARARRAGLDDRRRSGAVRRDRRARADVRRQSRTGRAPPLISAEFAPRTELHCRHTAHRRADRYRASAMSSVAAGEERLRKVSVPAQRYRPRDFWATR